MPELPGGTRTHPVVRLPPALLPSTSRPTQILPPSAECCELATGFVAARAGAGSVPATAAAITTANGIADRSTDRAADRDRERLIGGSSSLVRRRGHGPGRSGRARPRPAPACP